ncbi:MAG: hypothetical protein KC621_21390 [Myxococcales bacterium]|nr:hypothetical protein [Myxococcales bacterium]
MLLLTVFACTHQPPESFEDRLAAIEAAQERVDAERAAERAAEEQARQQRLERIEAAAERE